VSRWLPRLALPAAVAVAALFTLTPAVFAADTPGNNGTVKIQSTDVDSVDNADSANDPHISCNFSVTFADFDGPQDVTIKFNIVAPSGNGEELLSQDKSFDGSATYDYNGATDLKDLFTFTVQPQQGYHVKMTILVDGSEYKHKVFWLDCTPPTTPTDPETPPTTTTPPGGGSLPLTGPAIGGIVAAGVGLIVGGVVLVAARRRRDATDAS
jgi:LPXTG-motif cell wall-anchored protein